MSSPEEILRRNRELLESRKRDMKGQELLDLLPQGHGSGLDADMVDGLHAVEILSKARVSGGGGGSGSGESMVKHGNEWHDALFAERGFPIFEVDNLPDDDELGHAVWLNGDPHIHVCIEGLGKAPFGSCVFPTVEVLPQNNIGVVLLPDHPYVKIGEIEGFVFLLGDKHVYVGV